MSIKDDFSGLSTAEIARLFHETRKLAIEQRDGQERAGERRPQSSTSGGIHFADGSWCTCSGGIAAHAVEPERWVQDESGAMVRLEPGEERPTSLQDQRTEELLRMPQSQIDGLSDAQQAELMEFRGAVLEQRSQEFIPYSLFIRSISAPKVLQNTPHLTRALRIPSLRCTLRCLGAAVERLLDTPAYTLSQTGEDRACCLTGFPLPHPSFTLGRAMTLEHRRRMFELCDLIDRETDSTRLLKWILEFNQLIQQKIDELRSAPGNVQ